MSELSKLFVSMPVPAEDHPIIWRCYDCGSEKGFTDNINWESGHVDEVECNDSTNTDEDGNGEPECECGAYGWYCATCDRCKCEVCWKWFSVPAEPDEYMCKACVK